MKSKDVSKKLALNKQLITCLDIEEKRNVGGGLVTRTGCPSEWPCGTDYWGCNTDFLNCHPLPK